MRKNRQVSESKPAQETAPSGLYEIENWCTEADKQAVCRQIGIHDA